MNDFSNSSADMIERILQTVKSAVPAPFGNDLRNSLRNALQDVISELDVVSREELDIQKEVLQKTRAKVDEMERIIKGLEERLKIRD